MIEDICYKAEKAGKREKLLKIIPELQIQFPNISLTDLYEKAYDEFIDVG